MTNSEYFKSTLINSETSSTSGDTVPIGKTLIIFDFDDTLFCTKYFDTFSVPYKDIFDSRIALEEINPSLVKELKELENTIIELFNNLQQKYDIIIISNADIKWINNCLAHFLEELKEYINENNIKIYSAKNIFCKIVKDSNEWKVKCFKKAIKELYKNDLNFDLNVISIGDSNKEKKAVFNLSKSNEFNKVNIKFINMISFPSAASIILQLKYLNDNINDMISSNKSLYKMVIQIKNDKAEINCISPKKINNIGGLVKTYSKSAIQKKNLDKLRRKNNLYIDTEVDNKESLKKKIFNKLVKKIIYKGRNDLLDVKYTHKSNDYKQLDSLVSNINSNKTHQKLMKYKKI